MLKEHGSSTESRGWALVASLETFKGCTINIVAKGSGFNGLSTSLSGKVRRIELKTVEKSDDWFAINGLAGIENLFFDDLYWLYFSIVPENYVMVTRAIPFLRKQVSSNIDNRVSEYIKVWINLTKAITKDFGIKFIPRINFKTQTPIREMLSEVLDNPDDHDWDDVVKEIWQLNEDGQWIQHYFNETV
jgi:hypothetical protein